MNELVIQGLAKMIVLEWSVRALLLIGGLASAGFFLCSANFLTKAPHTVKAALLPIITGAGIGMAWAGVSGDILTGGVVSILQVTAIMALWFVVWDAGAHINKVLAHRASLRQMDRMQYEMMMRDITMPAYELSDILTPSGWAEIEKDRQ